MLFGRNGDSGNRQSEAVYLRTTGSLHTTSMEPIESKVESLTNTILKTDAESWEIRNKAILQLTDLVLRFKDESDETINEHFTANVFRMLKEPVKNMVI